MDFECIVEEKKDDKKSHAHPPPLNKFMHPRNPYRTPPSFKLLATTYSEFRAFCSYDTSGKVRLDFQNTQALAELAKCLLHKDFNLNVEIPQNRLVPTIPLRLNYLLWLEDLLGLVNGGSVQKQSGGGQPHSLADFVLQRDNSVASVQDETVPQDKKTVIGLDIGTGASCVYPLLGSKHFGWSMIATECDEFSFKCACDNVARNNLQKEIHLLRVSKHSIFECVFENDTLSSFVGDVLKWKCSREQAASPEEEPMETDATNGSPTESLDCGYWLDFTMCNPPFFSTENETDSQSKSRRERPAPRSTPTGALHEKVAEGGEVGFISKMIQESVRYRNRVKIFTTLVGTKADLKKVKQELNRLKPAHTTVTEFCQGRTMRWGVAWTYNSAFHLERIVSKKQASSVRPLTLLIPRSSMGEYSVTATWKLLLNWLQPLKIKPRVYKSNKYFIGATLKAYKALWLHQRRQKRELKFKQCNTIADPDTSATSDAASCSTSTADSPVGISSENKRKAWEGGSDSDSDVSFDSTPDSRKKKCMVDLGRSLFDMDDGNMKSTDVFNIAAEPTENDTDQTESEQSVVPDIDSISHESECTHARNDSKNSDYHTAVQDCEDKQGSVECGNLHSENVMEEVHTEAKSPSHVKPCLLKCNIHIKQIQGQISIELNSTGGTMGKDGLNQLLQYLKNSLKDLSD